MNILIFTKCTTEMSFLPNDIIELNNDGQKCPLIDRTGFTDRSDLFFGGKIEVSFFTILMDRSVFFSLKKYGQTMGT